MLESAEESNHLRGATYLHLFKVVVIERQTHAMFRVISDVFRKLFFEVYIAVCILEMSR